MSMVWTRAGILLGVAGDEQCNEGGESYEDSEGKARDTRRVIGPFPRLLEM